MELGVSPLFHGLETDTLNEILSRMRPRRYAAGEPVCLEGAVSDRLYLIESGVVEVVIGAGSSARSIARLRRGDIFGEMGLLADEPRSATILPVVPVQVLELDRPAYTEYSPSPSQAAATIAARNRSIEARRLFAAANRP
jgi:CRP-like cAMP-binding protein